MAAANIWVPVLLGDQYVLSLRSLLSGNGNSIWLFNVNFIIPPDRRQSARRFPIEVWSQARLDKYQHRYKLRSMQAILLRIYAAKN